MVEGKSKKASHEVGIWIVLCCNEAEKLFFLFLTNCCMGVDMWQLVMQHTVVLNFL